MLKKVASLVLAFSTAAAIAFAADFTDFQDSHWASVSVNTLVSEGTIGGYEDGTFRPDGTVTRAEFVKMLGKGQERFESDFNDVAADFWAYDYIMYSGLSGDQNGNFSPNTAITRGDVLNLLWKRAGSPAGFTAPKIISDQGDNKDAVAWGYTNGIMVGNDGMSLRLGQTMSRAEGAVLIIRSRNNAAAPNNFVDTLSDAALEYAYNDSKLLSEVAYSKDRQLTNGELARAASHLRTDEYDMSYYGLEVKLPFEEADYRYGSYAPDIYLFGRDVWGENKITIEFLNSKATVKDAVSALVFSLAESSNGTLTLTNKDNFYSEITASLNEAENKALTFAYENDIMLEANKKFSPDKILTCGDLAALILQLDHISGIFNKTVITAGEKDSYIKVKTSANFNQDTLPENKSLYQVIIDEVPTYIYGDDVFYTSERNPKKNFNYAREWYFVFSNYFVQLANEAKENGVDIRISYYPSLCYKYNSGYLVRVKCEIIGAKAGAKLSDIAETEINKELISGTAFFMDVNTHRLERGFDIYTTTTTIDKVIAIK